VFHKRKYVYDSTTDQFTKVLYPTNNVVDHYITHRGLSTDEEIQAGIELYEKNK